MQVSLGRHPYPDRSPRRARPNRNHRPAPGQGALPPTPYTDPRCLSERIASPNWLSDRLDVGLSHVAYHTRTLNKCGCLSLVDTARKRGATEHFYKAAPSAYVSSRAWRRVPQAILGGISGATLQSFMDRAVAALEAGTIDAREDTVLTWMPLLLDRRGWNEVVAIMEAAADRVLAAQQQSDERLAAGDSAEGTISTIAALANFETAGSRLA